MQNKEFRVLGLRGSPLPRRNPMLMILPFPAGSASSPLPPNHFRGLSLGCMLQLPLPASSSLALLPHRTVTTLLLVAMVVPLPVLSDQVPEVEVVAAVVVVVMVAIKHQEWQRSSEWQHYFE